MIFVIGFICVSWQELGVVLEDIPIDFIIKEKKNLVTCVLV